MSRSKIVVAALFAALAIAPGTLEAAKRSHRKTRHHRTAAKHSRQREIERKRQRHVAALREYAKRWEKEQLEPELPETE